MTFVPAGVPPMLETCTVPLASTFPRQTAFWFATASGARASPLGRIPAGRVPRVALDQLSERFAFVEMSTMQMPACAVAEKPFPL